ncbi:hypothetical protein [Cystobacter ferrugineus]|uniref:Uncharacterized protein n=1 Tax=Cystobacter ferrugineus TaxID=83449 RepID=A0A1L9B538_9BACT|nr:hypothetical protein [Cystobacter ferrugineus]OJH37365.1 hypothetical protein BON30_29175 [Cystobacter ferrugineus]
MMVLLYATACGPGGVEGPVEPVDLGRTQAGMGYASAFDYSEATGLPLGPKASDYTIAQLDPLLKARYPELITALVNRHGDQAKVRVIESYSRDYPAFLKGERLFLPTADGVLVPQTPPVTAATLQDSNCGSTHTCEQFTDPGVSTETPKVLLLLGWEVEVAGPVSTQGQSLVIVSELFRNNGHPISTRPTQYLGERPMTQVGTRQTPGGRDGRDAGAFILYTNIVDGLDVDATGQPGENGDNGKDVVLKDGKVPQYEVSIYNDGTWSLKCNTNIVEEDFTQRQTPGGNGGKAGHAAEVLLNYVTSKQRFSTPELTSSRAPTAWECFSKPELSCNDPRCGLNPSNAICDYLSEADGDRCGDGIDNDADGLIDCADPSCSENRYVGRCATTWRQPTTVEATAAACQDGIDNDADGRVDCDDSTCSGNIACGGEASEEACRDGIDNDHNGLPDCEDTKCSQFIACGNNYTYSTTGHEEASTAACSNQMDDDADGLTDCADPECKYNPFVQVCGGERTLSECTDGVDNDGNGYPDCGDFNCQENPYVLVCNAYPPNFLREATASTCTDGVDNDSDRFIDCNDYQCQNSQLANAVCGVFENTLAQCSDGVDNDGDRSVDCNDPNCKLNPFFGDLLCNNTVKTGHTPVSPPIIRAANYAPSSFSAMTARAGSAVGGRGGVAGKPIITSRTARRGGYCDSTDTSCNQTITRECVLESRFPDGTSGATGKTAAVTHKTLGSRRRVDVLRTLLTPNQWIADTATANTLFKRGQLKQAAFLYMDGLLRMHGALAHEQLHCEANPTDLVQRLLLRNTCTTISRDTLRMGYLSQGQDFYGTPVSPQLNPRDTFQRLEERFNNTFELLQHSRTRYLELVNAELTTAVLTAQQASLQTDIDAGRLELSAQDHRLTNAQQAHDAMNTALTAKQQEMQARYQEMVEVKNAPSQSIWSSLGSIVGNVGGLVLKAFGGQVAEAGLGLLGSIISDKFKSAFLGEATKKDLSKLTEAEKNALRLEKGELFSVLMSLAGTAAGSDPVKKAAKEGFSGYLSDLASGFSLSQTVVNSAVDRSIPEAAYKKAVAEYAELKANLEKAKHELAAARLDKQAMELRIRSAESTKQSISDYLTYNGSLTTANRLLLGRQEYNNSIALAEELTALYWRLMRQAQYAFLPFDHTTGALIQNPGWEVKDINLVNSTEMKLRYENLKAAFNVFTGSTVTYYRRAVGNPFVAATPADLKWLSSLGLSQTAARLYRIQVTPEELRSDARLRNLKNHRLKDVRFNIVRQDGTSSTAPVGFVARDGTDRFIVGPPALENPPKLLDFDLVTRDLYPTGSTRSALHYQQIDLCTSAPPTCDLANPTTCRTGFETQPDELPDVVETCSINRGTSSVPDSAATVTFFDRSLVGEWVLILPEDSYGMLGPIQAVELEFVAVGGNF